QYRGVILVWFAHSLDGANDGASDRGGPIISIRLDYAGDLARLEGRDAIARQDDIVTRLEREWLTRNVKQLDFITGHGLAQHVTTRIVPRFPGRNLAFHNHALQLGRQRVILVEDGDLAPTKEKERTVADADPLHAVRSERCAEQSRPHASEQRVL